MSLCNRSLERGSDNTDHLELLRAASAELVKPGERCARLRSLLSRLVPLVCSQLMLELDGPEGNPAFVAVFVDPALEKLALELRRRYASRAPAHPVTVALNAGGATLQDVTEELIGAIAQDAEHLALLRRFNATQMLVVPVRTNARVFGVLTANTEGGAKFQASDRILLELVAERIAIYLRDEDVARPAADADTGGVASGPVSIAPGADLENLLVGIVSHDLRNPLNVIIMASSLLSSQDLGERQRKLVVRIEAAGRRAARLVTDLLDLTAARAGNIELSLQSNDLHAVVAEAVDDLLAVWPGRVIEHERVGEATSLFDHARVQQIVDNLLTNALQHSATSSRVRVETRGEAGAIVVSVVNQGRPISAELMPRLFTPLRRGESAGVRRGSLGLGLFIVHQLVLAHGGTVDVSSDDQGTRFSVRLPRKPED